MKRFRRHGPPVSRCRFRRVRRSDRSPRKQLIHRRGTLIRTAVAEYTVPSGKKPAGGELPSLEAAEFSLPSASSVVSISILCDNAQASQTCPDGSIIATVPSCPRILAGSALSNLATVAAARHPRSPVGLPLDGTTVPPRGRPARRRRASSASATAAFRRCRANAVVSRRSRLVSEPASSFVLTRPRALGRAVLDRARREPSR